MYTVIIDHPDHASDFYIPVYNPSGWQKRDSRGYGKKIPTAYTLKYMGRERRIYSDTCSDSVVTYIIVNKEKVFVR